MAETIAEIQAKIEAAKNAQPSLSEYNSPSQTSRWRSWMYVFASIIKMVEDMWDEFRADVEVLIEQQEYGSLPWYCFTAKKFQYNSSVTYELYFDDSNKPKYTSINEADQIIKYAAAAEGAMNRILLKVAKDSGGSPTALDSSELTSFEAYIQRVKFAGIRIKCISADADKMKVFAEIFYSPIANPVLIQQQVESAINNYFISLPFNGVIHIEKLRDAIQLVTGVVDVKINSVAAEDAQGNIVTVDRYYVTHSGHARINSIFPLSGTLTLTPSNV